MASSKSELSDAEKELFKYTQERNYEEVKRLLTTENVSVDCVDDDGMTPLQHAAYKGDYKLCKLLLDCGADVNLSRHISKYSALTFAGLSGKVDVVSLLLEHGASTTSVNSINKTAAQMAAFVGNHHVVSTINNFIPIEEIDYFTKPRGLEKEPKLPSSLCNPLHKMVIMTNINPVRLAFYIQQNLDLLRNIKKVNRVLEILSEKQLKEEGNELLSLKFHHLAFILNACKSYLNVDIGAASCREILFPLIKCWIKGDENGFPVVLEKLLRQDVREYPYHDCSLFQQLVRSLAPVKIGDEPSAISILSEAVNGQRGIDNTVSCSTCGEPDAEKKCSACKSVTYCGKTCQKLHWFTHKMICPKLAEMQVKKEAELAAAKAEQQSSESEVVEEKKK
ncbi:ankyrin repeat and MYND domain-containing protein 2-like [Stegodyphus dumicola]|uniref:ankyrin repeat and MYND domain-containing protein 2-like n=1 Tax=Stegodyphus dumicola TaxID=202533 RepID=UPI0015B0373D|nr:ankyrin repeat and MYND domain-containing protein 2-like [Stegodyphus dumicola]